MLTLNRVDQIQILQEADIHLTEAAIEGFSRTWPSKSTPSMDGVRAQLVPSAVYRPLSQESTCEQRMDHCKCKRTELHNSVAL